jgi:dipeptidyl-peptidase-4
MLKIKNRNFFLFLLVTISLLNLNAQNNPITLEEIWQFGRFNARGTAGLRSMNDGKHYIKIDREKQSWKLNQYEYATGNQVKTLLTSENLTKTSGLDNLMPDDYFLSPDEQKVVLKTESESIYRYSDKAIHYIIDLKTGKSKKINEEGKQSSVTFNPVFNQIAYVEENNLFVKDLDNNDIIQITKDGERNKIINGQCDWVYEEEFSFDRAFDWDASGLYIAYYRFDETNVKQFNMPIYGKQLYPENFTFKYPKAGEENSKVKLFMYDMKGKNSIEIAQTGSDFEYIPRIQFTQNEGELSFQLLNRLQNKLELKVYDFKSKTSKTLLTENSNTYIEISFHLKFLKNKKQFIWTSERDGYQHVYLYDINKLDKPKQITKGNFEITDIHAVDETRNEIYVSSTRYGAQNHTLSAVNYQKLKWRDISPKEGYASIQFSKTLDYYVLSYSTAAQVPVHELYTIDGKRIKVLEENQKLKEFLSTKKLGKKEFFEIKTTDANLNAWMMKPADFNANKKYPVLMFVYGGPGSNTVKNQYEGANTAWYHLLNELGYIVVSVDNRGTGGKGRDFRICTYGQLGKLETIDQIAAAQYLATQSFVDKDRIGIQGWSYGGYMSSLCITKGADIFKVAIAVAPVTNWRYYDSIYTERYMGLPKDNASGYDDNSPISHIHKLKGKYLLVHGTADDNVHYQNAAELASSLQSMNKPFEMMIYTDKNHGIYGGLTRLHLYTLMTDFIKKNL